jgi:hypothetical protein
MTRYIPREVRRDVEWWKDTLANEKLSRSLLPRALADFDIWVDASTSWGIGLLVGDMWAAWKLADGWKSAGREIGWAETIAVELAALWIADAGICDAHVRISSDNTGVIGALSRGRSRSVPRNQAIRRISHTLAPINVTIDSFYVASASNRSDPISRGELGPADKKLVIRFMLPKELRPFLVHV